MRSKRLYLNQLKANAYQLILMYNFDVCPSNSADRHSIQFSVNKIIYKIFVAMAK